MQIYKPYKSPKNPASKHQCKDCLHYWGNKRCLAFSDGIPLELLNGEHDHWNSYADDTHPQDNGVRFKPKSYGQYVEHKYGS
jgi:hypothetical protein